MPLTINGSGNISSTSNVEISTSFFNVTGQYRQAGAGIINFVLSEPAVTNISFSGTINSSHTLNPSTIPSAARYLLCDIFLTAGTSDHQNFMISRTSMGTQKNWVDTRGNNPASEFGNLISQENIILTYFGESDSFSSNYGLWYCSQIVPSTGRVIQINNYGNSGSSGYIYIKVKGYSL